jgi:hypothetical protein
MAFTISTQPQSQSAFIGQNTTFTVQGSTSINPLSAGFTYAWFTSSGSTVTNVAAANAGNTSYTIDPVLSQNGLAVFATVNCLSGAPLTLQTTLTSNLAILTVSEDAAPFDTYDVWPESGKERHRRLRLLGYI